MISKHTAAAIVTMTLFWLLAPPTGAQPQAIVLPPLHPTALHVVGHTGTHPVALHQQQVHLTPNQLLVAQLAEAVAEEQRPDGRRRWTLPYRIYGVTATGQRREYRLVVDIDQGGMTFVPAAAQFEGRFYVGIVDAADPTSTGALPQPVVIQVTGAVDRLDPGTLQIARYNLPFVPVRVAAVHPGESIGLSFRMTFSPHPTEHSLPVIRPTLELTPTPRQVNGLGLQTAKLVVRLEGLQDPNGVEVSLDTDRGDLEATALKLGSAGIGETTIRSIGHGSARVTAKYPPAAAVSASVQFLWPWVFLLVAVFGGAAGSVTKWATAKEKKPKVAARSVRAVVGLGAGLGLIAAAAWAVGINVLGVSPAAKAGEAAVFALAALGGYVGELAVATEVTRSSSRPPK